MRMGIRGLCLISLICWPALAQSQDIESRLSETLPESMTTARPLPLEKKVRIELVPQPPKIVMRRIPQIPDAIGRSQVRNFFAMKRAKSNAVVPITIRQPPKKKTVVEPAKPTFELSIAAKHDFDSNILNTNTLKRSDWFTTIAPELKGTIPLNKEGTQAVTIASGASFVRHNDFKQRDENVTVQSIAFTQFLDPGPLDQRALSVAYFLISGFDDEFSVHNYNIHRPEIKFSHSNIPIGADICKVNGADKPCMTWSYFVAARRPVFDKIDNQDNATLLMRASVSRVLPPHLTFLPGAMIAGANATITGVRFDDFPQSQRNDVSLDVNGSLAWITPNGIEFGLNVGYGARDSTIDPLDYDQVGLSAGVTMKVKLN